VYVYSFQLIKDLNVHDFGEKIDNFFSQQITETVRAYQLEQTSTEDREHDTDYIDCFVQSVLQWAEGKPQGEILQCVKFQPKTR
jgi:flavoprotein